MSSTSICGSMRDAGALGELGELAARRVLGPVARVGQDERRAASASMVIGWRTCAGSVVA